MLLRLVPITLATILVCTHSTAGLAETIRTKNEFIGPVRTVTVKAYGLSQTDTYDQAGNLLEAIIDLAHGDTSTRYLFTHDQQGNLQEEFAIDKSGKLLYQKRFAYAQDSHGRETASVTTSHDGEFLYAEFSLYDRFGNLSEELLVHDTTAHRSLFDVLGRVVYSSRYNKRELSSELKHGYDEWGRLKELISYSSDGTLTGRVVNEYDEAGRRVRVTTEKFYAGLRSKWITTYEFDRMGNWVKELTSEEPPASQESGPARTYAVRERVIQYYETHNTKTPCK
ncbi:MAG TPA: hypothetical protein VN638_12495 [Nitrospiraceae bacterium]|nr:hypothetical protein [Nitrospiraceae bacterium]